MTLFTARMFALFAQVGLLPCYAVGQSPPPASQPSHSSRGLPSDPGFFPLAVWLQSPANAAKYEAIGINVYVGLWRGPTSAQLDALDRAGMYLICDQNEVGLHDLDRKTIVGWMHGDEPDNAQPLPGGKGYGPPIPPDKIVADYQRMKRADPSRPVMLNLGQGVAWDGYYGRGVRSHHPEDYPEYLKGCDIASFDIYPVVHERAEIAGKLEYVAHGVKRLVDWTGGSKPIWCCIETTHIHNQHTITTPAQLRAEVWMALIHGAKGIIYFCHEFSPKFIEAGLLAHPEIVDAVKQVNAQIRELAPLLNGPEIRDRVRISSSDADVPIASTCRTDERAIYVFAVSMRNMPTTAKIEVPGSATMTIEVLEEGRTIDATRGQFEDHFDGYAVHLYRIRK